MFIEPTITWVPSGFSGYIWLETTIVLKRFTKVGYIKLRDKQMKFQFPPESLQWQIKVTKRHRQWVPDARARTVKTPRADCHSLGSGDEHGPLINGSKMWVGACQTLSKILFFERIPTGSQLRYAAIQLYCPDIGVNALYVEMQSVWYYWLHGISAGEQPTEWRPHNFNKTSLDKTIKYVFDSYTSCTLSREKD